MSAADRARRLATGDLRGHVERVADALEKLTEVIREEPDAGGHLWTWGMVLGFVGSRARDEFVRTVGREP